METALCVVCGQGFTYERAGGRRRVCCSDECRRARAIRRSWVQYHIGPQEADCEWCYRPLPRVNGIKRFCSHPCRAAATSQIKRHGRIDRTALAVCHNCGLVCQGRGRPKPTCITCRAQVRMKWNGPSSQANLARKRAYRNGERFTIYDLIERDGPQCHLCGVDADPTLGRHDPLKASIDHLVPITRGGEHRSSNAKVAHLRCNSSRGNRLLPDAA